MSEKQRIWERMKNETPQLAEEIKTFLNTNPTAKLARIHFKDGDGLELIPRNGIMRSPA